MAVKKSFQITMCSLQRETPTAQREQTYTVDDAVKEAGFGLFQYRLLFLAGLAWAADSFEIIILSIIGQILACEWKIHLWQNALLTTGVFFGMTVGCPTFGIIADKYGRKTSLAISLSVMFVSGSLSAVSPSYVWMLVFRTIVGFSLGGIAQVLTLCCEYVSSDIRGKTGLYLCYFWSIGTVGVILVAWAIMENTNNWRLLVAITAVPALLVISGLKWFPESARYNLVSNKYAQAEKLVHKMASMNGKELPPGKLSSAVTCENRGRIADLFLPEYRRSTMLFCYMCFTSALCYYSIALMTPVLIQKGSIAAIAERNESYFSFFEDFLREQPCENMTRQDYVDLLWTSAAEFPGLVVFTVLIELIGRKRLACGSCVISGILVLLLLMPTEKEIFSLVLLFGARGNILALFQLVYIMTSEAFPTTLRAVATGTGSALSRVGGLLSPYLSQNLEFKNQERVLRNDEILLVTNPRAAVSLLGAIILSTGISAMFLPVETKGISLQDLHEPAKKQQQQK